MYILNNFFIYIENYYILNFDINKVKKEILKKSKKIKKIKYKLGLKNQIKLKNNELIITYSIIKLLLQYGNNKKNIIKLLNIKKNIFLILFFLIIHFVFFDNKIMLYLLLLIDTFITFFYINKLLKEYIKKEYILYIKP